MPSRKMETQAFFIDLTERPPRSFRVRLGGFVASIPGFTEQHKVMNGASDLIAEVLGEAGRHARAAVGTAALPLDAAVEVEALFAVD